MEEENKKSKNKYQIEFEKDFEAIEKEINNLDSIGKNILSEIEDAKIISKKASRRGGSSPFTYIFNMYANYSSNRTSLIQLMKERINVRKMIFDFELKDIKSSDGEENFKSIAKEMFEMIKEDSAKKRLEDNNSDSVIIDVEDFDEDEFSKVALEAFKEELGEEKLENTSIDFDECSSEDKNDEEELEDTDENDENFYYAFDKNFNLYLVDENDEIQEELDYDEGDFEFEETKKGKAKKCYYVEGGYYIEKIRVR